MPRSFAVIVAGLAAFGCIADTGWAQEVPPKRPALQRAPLPKFKDYPTEAVYKGKPARLHLATQDQRDRRELYAAAAAGGVTLAGHYAVVKFGCGSSCVSSDILDLRTGRTIAVPFTISGWREIHDDFEPIEAKPDSRLIVLLGARNEEPPLGYHYYVLENGKLRFLRTFRNEGNFTVPLSRN